jgi:hypothetical protein
MQKMEHHKKTKVVRNLVIVLGVCVLLGAGVVLTYAFPARWEITEAAVTEQKKLEEPEKPKVQHVATPKNLGGIYMSQCVVGTPSFRDKLVALIDDTSLNAVVIDIKDFTGKIAFTTDNPVLAASVSDECGARDMKDFVKLLHEKGIYVIGRITVFQDPYYTKLHPTAAVQSATIRPGQPWRDNKGLSFIDVSHRPYWDYVVALSKEAYEVQGFDELNYDYIRYPSDGPMSDARYVNPNKAEAIELFWAYLHENVKPLGVVMSADLFGMAATNYDDLNIGQQLERALPYFDYIMPMVYPSHYPKNYLGLANPNSDPYKVVHHSMAESVRRTLATSSPVKTLSGVLVASSSPAQYTKESYSQLKMRPWLQDFDYGKDYTADDIEAQIKATTDAGLTSWVFWDAGNKYDSLRTYLRRQVATP